MKGRFGGSESNSAEFFENVAALHLECSATVKPKSIEQMPSLLAG
jgi:hypothetical protein